MSKKTRRNPRMSPKQLAASLGEEFARQINETPHDRDNWGPLERGEEIPSEDYAYLRRALGEVTPEMETAYRAAFNATLGE